MKRLRSFDIIVYIILLAGTALILIPISNMIMSCFKTNADINRVVWFPTGFYIQNFVNVFKGKYVLSSFVNSMIITLSTLGVAIAVCSVAAYPLARRKERPYGLIYYLFLSSMMIPTAGNLVHIYTLIRNLHLIDTRTAIIFIMSAGSIPMGILLYTGFIKTIPAELDESATMDGCGYFRRFIKIIFPLLKPVTVSYAILAGIGVWNEFLMSMLFLRSPMKKTIILTVYSFRSEHESDWGAIYVMLTIAVIPPVIFFLLMQKHFYKGITIGAVKG
jgi:raffinose/stachyose/melibiose transport system permease protein